MNELWDSLFVPAIDEDLNNDRKIKFHSARAKHQIYIIKKILGSPGFVDYDFEGRAGWFGDHIFDRILVEDNYQGFFEIVTVSIVSSRQEIEMLTPDIIAKVCRGWTERNLLTLQCGSFSQAISIAFGLKSYVQGKISIQNLPNVVFSIQQKLDQELESIKNITDAVIYPQIEKCLGSFVDGDTEKTERVEKNSSDSSRSSGHESEESSPLRSPSPVKNVRRVETKRDEGGDRDRDGDRKGVVRQIVRPRSPQCVPVSSVNPFKVTESEPNIVGTSDVGIKTIVGRK